MSPVTNAALRSAAIAVLFCSCGGSPPTQPPAAPPPSPVAQPSPSPSLPPVSADCPFAPGPVARLALSPRALLSNDVITPMRVRVISPSEEVLCLDKDKSHRLDFNLNQKNEAGQECCWVDGPRYRIRQDPLHMVTDFGAIDANGFILRVRVEPKGQESSFGVEARLDGVFNYPWESGGRYLQEPLRVITLPGQDIPALCPCIYFGNGRYEGGNCVR